MSNFLTRASNSLPSFKEGDLVFCRDILLGDNTRGKIVALLPNNMYEVDIGGGVRGLYHSNELTLRKTS